jgi:5-methylcytosine-specific restriction endonuclease McrA
MNYLPLFKMPTPMKITGRSSSITNAFINSIIPVVPPTNEQVKEALSMLNMLDDNYQCAYCGSTATEWDHLRPLVLNKKPTGYISEIHNLVPACGKCNQSKGNKEWRQWMLSDATLSPKTKGTPDLHERIERLQLYESWGTPTKIDFESIVGKEVWDSHWKNWEQVQDIMRESQTLAEKINREVAIAYEKLQK